MPARTTSTPGGVPSNGTILFRPGLPQGKIGHILLLVLILGHAGIWLFVLLGRIAMWVVVATAVASGVDYFRRFARSAPAA